MVKSGLSLVKMQFYSELATNLVKTLSIEPNKFNSNTTNDFYTDIFNNTTKK